MQWVERIVRDFRLADKPTLEIGSYDVNGSVRPFFSGPYLGVDLRPGPGVDFVHDIETAAVTPTHPWTTVVSTEMLEHTPRPWLAVANMVQCLGPRRGGLILTTRGFEFPRHDHPADYYRFSLEAIGTMMIDNGGHVLELREDPACPGVFCYARFNEPRGYVADEPI